MDASPPADSDNALASPGRALRRRAEVMIQLNDAQSLDSAETLSPQEAQRMLHELRVHQVELELQNEELRRSQLELEGLQARYFNLYNLAPVGRHKLTVCTNLPCALSGGVHAAEYLKSKLGIDFNETTPDGKFTLKEGECMGACGDAPVMLVNNHHMRCFMTPEEIDRLLAECK